MRVIMFRTSFIPYPVSANYTSQPWTSGSFGCCGARVSAFRSCCGQNNF
nr:MAG TPA: hypothetical protein [Caudoviricetes sp.]